MAQELKTINEWQFIGRLAVILYHKIDADPSLPEADVIIQMVNTCKTSVWLYCLVYFHWYGSCVDYTNNGGGLRRIFKRNNNELSLIILSMWKHSFEKQRQSFHILPIVSQLFPTWRNETYFFWRVIILFGKSSRKKDFKPSLLVWIMQRRIKSKTIFHSGKCVTKI